MVKIGMLEQDILHRTDSGSVDSLVMALFSVCTKCVWYVPIIVPRAHMRFTKYDLRSLE